MTREARVMTGIILITVPTIQYGRMLSGDMFDEEKQRIHGQSVGPEFLSCFV